MDFFQLIILLSADVPVKECLKVTLLYVHFLPSLSVLCVYCTVYCDSMCQNTNVASHVTDFGAFTALSEALIKHLMAFYFLCLTAMTRG